MFFAVVIDDAISVLNAELACGAIETLDEALKRVRVCERIDRGEAVNPEALYAELRQPKHVLQPDPG